MLNAMGYPVGPGGHSDGSSATVTPSHGGAPGLLTNMTPTPPPAAQFMIFSHIFCTPSRHTMHTLFNALVHTLVAVPQSMSGAVTLPVLLPATPLGLGACNACGSVSRLGRTATAAEPNLLLSSCGTSDRIAAPGAASSTSSL